MASTVSGDRTTVLFASAAMTMMIGNLIAGKTARDAFFLTYFDVTELPRMMIVTAVVSVFAVLGFSRLLSRLGPARLIPGLYLVSAVLFAGEWFALSWAPRVATVVLYLHATVLTSLLISGYWSIINERFDPYSAKKVVSRLMVFNSLGTIFGGAAANGVSELIDSRAIVAMLCLLHVLVGLALVQVSRGQRQVRPADKGETAGLLTILKGNRMIQRMALLILALAMVVALLDYLMKSTLQSHLDSEDLVAFFSYFYVGIGIGSVLLQSIVGGKALRWLGLGGTMAVLPLTVIFGSLATLVYRHLLTVTLLRAGANLLSNTLFKSGFELLFTPIAHAEKRASKVLIDVGADRSGEMLGSILILGLLLIPGPTEGYLLVCAVAVSCAMLLLIGLLHRGYVRQLASNLRNGALDPDEIEIRDATTERTVALTRTTLERDRLLREVAHSRGSVRIEPSSGIPGTSAPGPVPATGSDSAVPDPVLEDIRELRSRDTNRIRRVLTSKTSSPELLPHIVPLLRRPEVLGEALNALRPLAPTATGQLVDALLDRRRHPLIRRRVPLLLAGAGNVRAIQGLTLGLDDPELDVRFRCGEAIGRIRENDPRLPFDAEQIWRVVHEEIARLRTTNYRRTLGVEPLRHLFNLFGIVFGPEVVNICYEALNSEDRTLRGTALEYLDNQLPQDVRATLWPLISTGEPVKKSERSVQDILQDLRRAITPAGREGKDSP